MAKEGAGEVDMGDALARHMTDVLERAERLDVVVDRRLELVLEDRVQPQIDKAGSAFFDVTGPLRELERVRERTLGLGVALRVGVRAAQEP